MIPVPLVDADGKTLLHGMDPAGDFVRGLIDDVPVTPDTLWGNEK